MSRLAALPASRRSGAACPGARPAHRPAPRRPRRPPARGRTSGTAARPGAGRSSPRPLRIALLEERLDALLDVLGGERDRQLRAQVVQRVLEGHVHLAVDRVLAHPHQHRRLGRQLLRPVAHSRVELTGRDDAVDDPQPLGLVRVDPLPEQQQLGRLLARDVAVDERHDHEREHADVDLRGPEGRPVGGDDQVTGERQAQGAGEAVAVGRADHRLAQRADRAEQAREPLDAVEVLVHQRHVGREAAEVAARAEGRLVRRRENYAAHVVVAACMLERLEQVVQELVAQRVSRVRLVERDRRDAVGGFVQHRLPGHPRHPIDVRLVSTPRGLGYRADAITVLVPGEDNLRRMLFAATAALALTIPASALGARPQPLNQYLVSHINPKLLQRAGYDMSEAVTPQAKGKFAIVATPSQAATLRAKGAKVTAPFGETKKRPRALRARASARAAATLQHGYNVFRPWSLDPAPCPGTCSTPLMPLKDWYHQYAAKFPSVVKEEVIGHSVQGQAIVAYKVTQGARDEADASRPTVLFDSTQHAREWISTEVNRRLFKYVLDNSKSKSIKSLLQTREVWFIPMNNPDGYDYTFLSKGTRLWRKNLRDNNRDGQITNQDGVDPNRNWPFKWNYDLEGASNDFVTETFHGASAGSEPEVQAIRGLEARIKPLFQIDYHSFAKLILYPEGWQVETPSTDAPLMAALAGDDDKPAVAGFDPDVSAELYTTNGDITDDALHTFGTQAYTVELSGGTGPDVGGTVDGPESLSPGGFVFQDDEAAVQAEFQKTLEFALALAKSARKPDEPQSHLGNTAPDMVPTTFSVSHGDPQVVEVNAKRSLGDVKVFWQVGGGAARSASLSEYKGGERYGTTGVYYHPLRGQVSGARPGDQVKVWFGKGRRTTDPFTYTLKADSGKPVLLLTAEDYTGNSS